MNMSCQGWRYELKFRRTPDSLGSVTAVRSMGMRSLTSPHHLSL
nr:unnamed protein product [Callosobruchus analis]